MRNKLKKAIIFFLQFLPLKDDFVLESHPDFSDNTGAFYQYMLERGVNKRHKIHWALHSKDASVKKEGLPRRVDTFYLETKGIRQMWRKFCALYFSRYIIDSNTFIHKLRKGQRRIHLGHGMPIKIAPDYSNLETTGECDGYVVTGTYWLSIFADIIGIPRESLLPLGYPRNDIFSMAERKKRDNVGQCGLGRYLMWLPTYRQHYRRPEQMKRDESGDKGALPIFPFGMPEVQTKGQLTELDQQLADKDMILYFRPHPVQDLSHFHQEELSHVVLADDAFLAEKGWTLYGMLAGAHGLITDYSSVYFDFLLTERPIGLTIGDRACFFQSYNCPFSDFKKEVLGFYIESFEELLAFVRGVAEGNVPGQEGLLERKARYHSYPDGGASERIYQYMEEKWFH